MQRNNNPLSQQQIRTIRQLITNDIAYYIQYQNRDSGSRSGQLQNEDYQLFIDNDNALVYAANNQIIDCQASDFALKIAADGLLTVKNLKVLNFDFVAQINQLINEVNQLQSAVGSIDSDIIGVKNDIITIQQELARQQHFRGYYLLNTDIQNLSNSADGEFALSAESGTVWMYDSNWYNSGDIVPDQVTPASDAVPLVDSGAGVAGICTEYARGDHQHPLQISDALPHADTTTGEADTANTYAKSDHTHHVNLSNDVPLKDSGTGTSGTSNIYASAQHQHPLNVDPTVANVPLVNTTAAANGMSDFYSRNDHVHPQQLTYTGLLASAMFIKNGAQATDVLLANGDSKPKSDIAGDGFVAKTGKTLQAVQDVLRHSGDDEESEDDEDYITRGTIYNQYVSKTSPDTIIGRKIFKNDYFWIQPASSTNPLILFKNSNNLIEQLINSNELILTINTVDPVGIPLYINYRGSSLSTQYPNSQLVQNYILKASSSTSFAGVTCGTTQIDPMADNFNDGLRISRTIESTGSASIQLGCSRSSNIGQIAGQQIIYTATSQQGVNALSFKISLASDAGNANRGLVISDDGNTSTFNGRV